VSEGQVAGAVVFFVLFALLVGGLGLYYVGGFPILAEWWERFKANQAARAAQRQEQLAALDREQQWGIETSFAPAVVIGGVVERMTREGWALQNRTDTSASFAQDQGADACAGCALMLLFLLPGILYLLLANRTARITAAAYPHEGGSRLVIGGDDPATRNRLAQWARELREGDLQTTEELPPSEQPSHAINAPTLATRLRELSEARDAGLITEEEFEAKKKDLLDRM
jgi:hypothetical protein